MAERVDQTAASGHTDHAPTAVVSDYSVVRAGLRALLGEGLTNVVAESPRSMAGVAGLWDVRLRLVLLDLSLPLTEACFEICRHLPQRPDAPTIIGVHCWGPHPTRIADLVSAGLGSYVSIARDGSALRAAVQALRRHEAMISVPDGSVLDTLLGGPMVTRLDVQIIGLLVRGLTDKEVGSRLGLSASTVKHRVNAVEKDHGLAGRCQLGAWAIRLGVVVPGEDNGIDVEESAVRPELKHQERAETAQKALWRA